MMENNIRNYQSRKISSLIVSVLILAMCTIFSAYMLILMRDSLNEVLFWIALPAVVGFGATLIVLDFIGYDRIVKLGLICLVVAVFVIGVFFAIFATGYFHLLSDVDALREEIAKTGSIKLAFVFVQFAQVCILPIPSTVTTMMGLLLFSPFEAVIYSLVGMLAGAVVMYYFGRYAGRKAVDWALGKEDVEKYLGMIKGRDNAILTAMFVLPIFPDDLLCAVAGITKMNSVYFFVVITISRTASTIVSVLFFSGNFIPLSGWWLLLWGAIIALLITITIIFFKNINKIEQKIASITSKKKK